MIPLIAPLVLLANTILFTPGDVNRVHAIGDAEFCAESGALTVRTGVHQPAPGVRIDFTEPVSSQQGNEFLVSVSNCCERPIVLSCRFVSEGGAADDPKDGILLRPFAHGTIPVNGLASVRGMEGKAVFDHVDIISGAVSFARTFAVLGIEQMRHSPLLPDLSGPAVRDSFGQVKGVVWRNRIATTNDLRRAAREERRTLERTMSKVKLSGPFRVDRIEGRWRFITANGRRFFSLGVDNIRQKDGGSPDYTAQNLRAKYSEGWLDSDFARLTVLRLTDWGFNTIGYGSDARLWAGRQFPYVDQIATKSRPLDGNPAGMKDVFAPEFVLNLRDTVEAKAAALNGDRSCLGWYCDKELPWGVRDVEIAEDVLKSSADQPAKAAFVEFLQRKYPTISAFNSAWGTTYADWSEFLTDRSIVHDGPYFTRDLTAFTRHFADRYFRTVKETIETHVPGLLYLGCRFDRAGAEIWRAAADSCDVVSVSCYQELPAVMLPDGSRDRPILISEFHFGTFDRGDEVAGRRAAASERDRAMRFGRYVRAAVESDQIIGVHWSHWRDCPRTKDEPGGHVGFLDITDAPNRELIRAIRFFRDLTPL